MTTVMLIPGAMSFGYTGMLQTYLGGPCALLAQLAAIEGQPPPSSPPTIESIAYNDWDPIRGAYDGANKIDHALQTHFRSSADPVVVVGHSYGSVSSVLWLRNQGALSWIDPAKLRFVLLANSIRPNNGLAAMMGLYGGFGPSGAVRYRTYDVARQWDKWADYPNVWASPHYWEAVSNVNVGDLMPAPAIHITYENIRLTDRHWESRIGLVTFMLFKTHPVPLASATREQIESAYDRVVPVPAGE